MLFSLLRLLDTFVSTSNQDGYVEVEEISAKYEESFPDKENRYIFSELGKLMKHVFPSVQKKRLTIQKQAKRKREWVYTGIKFKVVYSADQCTNQHDSIQNNHVIHSVPGVENRANQFSLMDECWTKVPQNFKFIHGWTLIEPRTSDTNLPTSYEYHNDNVKCSNIRVTRELKISKDLNYTLHVAGKIVPAHIIPLSLKGSQTTNFKSLWTDLFSYCASVRLCTGFEVCVKKNTFDIKGNITGKTTQWHFRCEGDTEWREHYRHQAVDCDLILATNSKQQKFCNKCSCIKHRAIYKTLNPLSGHSTSPSKKKFKRESYMTEDEIQAKLNKEKTKRRKAEKRESYLREKIENGMKEFDEEDNKDFIQMFNLVEQESLNDDMKLFFKVQQENLGKKSSRGYRWHPK